MRIKEKEQKQ